MKWKTLATLGVLSSLLVTGTVYAANVAPTRSITGNTLAQQNQSLNAQLKSEQQKIQTEQKAHAFDANTLARLKTYREQMKNLQSQVKTAKAAKDHAKVQDLKQQMAQLKASAKTDLDNYKQWKASQTALLGKVKPLLTQAKSQKSDLQASLKARKTDVAKLRTDKKAKNKDAVSADKTTLTNDTAKITQEKQALLATEQQIASLL